MRLRVHGDAALGGLPRRWIGVGAASAALLAAATLAVWPAGHTAARAAWASASDALTTGAQPGAPERGARNYALAEERLFQPDPDAWGGAFVDGDVLVVLSHGRSMEEAWRLLAAAGVSGAVEVRMASRSLAQLNEMSNKALAFGSDAVVSVGPRYSTNTVVLGLRHDDQALREYLASIDPEGFEIESSAAAKAASWVRALVG